MLSAWLAFEIMITFVQWIFPSAPFSRLWRREGHGFRHLYFLLALLGPLVYVPVGLLFHRPGWGPPAVLGLQVAVLLLWRALLRRRMRALGIHGLAPRRR
jgi:hypothetical protein